MKRIVIVGTGGSIAMRARHSLDLVDYGLSGDVLPVADLLAQVPELAGIADVRPVDFVAKPSEAMGPEDWRQLAQRLRRIAEAGDRPDGVVVVHGTSTLEEAAWFLDLALNVAIPVVVVGALRPFGTLGSDAALNLLDAVRVAAEPAASCQGVLVVLNGRIHGARDVSKASTYALDAFQSGEAGLVGMIDATGSVVFHRDARPRGWSFDLAAPQALPRIDVVFAYAGADGVETDAFVAAGSRGIVVAGMAPGVCSPAQWDALTRAAERDVRIVFCSRSGQGRVIGTEALRARMFIAGDTLTPQKARILLMLSCAANDDMGQTRQRFLTA